MPVKISRRPTSPGKLCVVTASSFVRLRAMALFGPLSDEELEATQARGSLRTVEPGEVLVREGDRADNVYVVLSGKAQVELHGVEVGPVVEPGECVGELAVLDEAPRAATVTALTRMSLLSFTAETFAEILDELPALREEVIRALTRRMRQVSTGWAQLAVDTDVLLDAYYALQGSSDEGNRNAAIKEAAALLRRLAESTPVPRTGVALDLLTPAERRVADLVARGLSNAAVASELFLSEHTVASHLKHIYVKLGLPSRVALAGIVLRSA